MKHIVSYVIAAGICGTLAAPAGAHTWGDPEWIDPPTDSQPDQRQQPTVVYEPDGQRVTVVLSDPARPATLEMNIVMGSIMVKGANRKDVLILARGPAAAAATQRRQSNDAPPAGLRRLTQGTPFTVEEDKNTVSVDVDNQMRAIDFIVEVPMHTNLDLETVQGAITVEGVEGELEVDSVNGAVNLASVGGCVVAHSMNGKLAATITRTNPGQPMAFTSMNGTVDVTLPSAVKANFKLRSDQGDVYTDFDLQTRGEPGNPNPGPRAGRRGVVRTSVNVDHAIYGAVNGGGPDFEIRTFNGNVYVRKGK